MTNQETAAAFYAKFTRAFCVTMDNGLEHIIANRHPNLNSADVAEVAAAVRWMAATLYKQTTLL